MAQEDELARAVADAISARQAADRELVRWREIEAATVVAAYRPAVRRALGAAVGLDASAAEQFAGERARDQALRAQATLDRATAAAIAAASAFQALRLSQPHLSPPEPGSIEAQCAAVAAKAKNDELA